MVNDLVMDVTLQAHQEVFRVHAPGPSGATSQPTIPSSRPSTPASAVDGKMANSAGTGTNTPTSAKDGNLYLECVNCSRQIASNRYAPHLTSCLGLNTARRGAARTNNKSKPPSEAGRSLSPASDAGAVSEESPKGKAKGKSLNKRVDEAEFNLKRKRPASPQVSPAKNQKKQKTSGTTPNFDFQLFLTSSRSVGSPVSRLKATVETSGLRNNSHFSPSNSQSKIPSKLRDSSTASFIGGSSSPTSSRDSSPGGIASATPASSFSRSPHIMNKAVTKGPAKVNGVGPPRRPSPPRPPSIHVPDYSIDVEGEETGKIAAQCSHATLACYKALQIMNPAVRETYFEAQLMESL
ncbi:hypothetical protein C0993_007441 [Termitomyces sp. T159_Od127]|nr:hypothetical protein C0993_007441 [Termitomyces sp. T159_Od127]